MPTAHHSAEQVIQALRDSHGLVSVAAKRLGVSRQAIYKRIETSPAVAAARDDAREAMLDVAEQALYERVKAGDSWAIVFYLKTQGRSRGYGERQTIDLPHGVAVPLPRDDGPPGAELQRKIAWAAQEYRKVYEVLAANPPPEPAHERLDLTDPVAIEAASTLIERMSLQEHQAYLDRKSATGHGSA